jgi:hypothetical protein
MTPRASLPVALALWLSLFLSLPTFVLAVPGYTPEETSRLLREPGMILLHGIEFDVREGAPPAPEGLALSPDRRIETRYWLVHVVGPLIPSVRTELEGRGVTILSYVPNHTYLVRAEASRVRELLGTAGVDWVGPYRPDYKLSPEIGRVRYQNPDRPVLEGELLLILCAFEGEDLDRIAAEALAGGADVLGINRHPATPRIRVRVREGGERDLARIEGVAWIEEEGEIVLRNNTTRWVAQSNQSGVTSIWDQGLHGENRIIGHIDGPIQMESCYFEDLDDNTPGPDHRKVVAYRGSLSSNSHGAHTAGTAAGLNSSESLDHAGIAYEARISHTRYGLITGYGGGPSNLYSYFELANADGAHDHTNSWGDDGRTTYTPWARDIDRFSRNYEDDLVLFAVTNTSTLKTPENAKNVLAVGATHQAPNQHMHGLGGEGPTNDGRRKPEIYLPGISIVSASTGSCGTVSSSGTSMACPAVTACATLVRQYYEEGFHPSGSADTTDAISPSGALVKATLLNGTVDMTGESGYPSNREGWGRLLLDNALYFTGESRKNVIRDVWNADGLDTGELDEYLVDVTSGEDVRITMVFTDRPALIGANPAVINDLDLEVEGPDGLYLGNVFSGGVSVTGGSADNLNNVERVVLGGGSLTSGEWTVRVRGTSIPDGPQGYALHVSGDVEETNPVVGVQLARLLPLAGEPSLGQNNPNPFSGSTTIRFHLPVRNEVELSVFDIGGRRLQTLASGTLEAGDYTVHWDGRDETGEKVAAGIYFYRLEGSEVDETRKMVVLR